MLTPHSHSCWVRCGNDFSKQSLFPFEPMKGKGLLQSQIKPNCQCSLDTNNPTRDSWASEVAWRICLKGPLKQKRGELGPSHSSSVMYLKTIKQSHLTSLVFTLCVILKMLENPSIILLWHTKIHRDRFPKFLPANPCLDPFLHLLYSLVMSSEHFIKMR